MPLSPDLFATTSSLNFRVSSSRPKSHHWRGLSAVSPTNSAPASPVSSAKTEHSPPPPKVYDPANIEPKWQRFWAEKGTFKTRRRSGKDKKYILDMFPYPSGAGLHVGHPEGYTASDVMARYYRMRDYDVLHPMGWDSFGLPAEQHAINTGTHPADTTAKNIQNFKRQLSMLGFSYDWDREVATTDEKFVKWTQWIFLQLFKKGLAEQSKVSVNWCPALGTVLANEEVIDGLSERGGHPVERLPLRQWVLKITEYGDKLLEDLEGLDWPEGTLTAQRTWIGRSEGAEIDFKIDDPSMDQSITVFTTRPDTLMGVTYVSIAPEHPLARVLPKDEETLNKVDAYVKASSSKSDLERTSQGAKTEKTGVPTGAYAIHPLSGEKVPIWVADYVLGGYGSGAVMAVPSHDERDFAFASAFDLPKKTVIEPVEKKKEAEGKEEQKEKAFTGDGVLVNSGEFSGLKASEARDKIVSVLEAQNSGRRKIQYKLRDWVFSRQRYWGEPIPIYFPVVGLREGGDPRSGDSHEIDYSDPRPVPESELPLKLPEMERFEPGEDPQGCLARAIDWRYFQIKNEKTGEMEWFARETNTMPQWAGSCWYYLRFIDPQNEEQAWSKEADEDWMPVDLYVGGQEHATLHLLYSRFWHKVLFELGLTKSKEPFQKLVHQGMILGADGEKMSKSRGNVVNPDDVVDEHGADALRMYEMFMGPLEATKPWQTEQVSGVVRFRDKVFGIATYPHIEDIKEDDMDPDVLKSMHKTIKKVTMDIESLSFNTAISALMVFVNTLQQKMKNEGNPLPRKAVEALVLMASPFAPHLGEECWEKLGYPDSLAYTSWPEYDEKLCVDSTVKIGVQVNGKVRGEIEIEKDATEDAAKEKALSLPRVAELTSGKDIKKFIYRPGKIVNVVVGK
eukprot:CAMPEP_0114516212 /NCGR_PEP_ID=MMETSP0109-20121206/17207_1 /TAXON_ID=29199 /ORGANISM="Chlorarachnion reptans, Strain CCCM449" /LENGTH=902 /DNA_ID=CAMNT_0001696585 /DNA_START=260 /DNA_END=2968 /DNA_ORIENTATION=-